jgi:hypothetical protein
MVKKWLVSPFPEDLFHAIWTMVSLVKSTVFAQMERKTLVQCFTVLRAALRKQWGTKESSHTFLNQKTAQASRQVILSVKVWLVERIGRGKETVGKQYRVK